MRVAAVPVGREDTLAELDGLLTHGGAIVIDGEPGIGKTTVLRAALDRCGLRPDWEVVCHEPERDLGLSVLADFFANLPRDVLSALSPPLAHIVDVVLFRASADDRPVEARGLGAAAHAALHEWGRQRGRVLLSIDDLHWCDPGSARAFEYALRRVDRTEFVLLATRRDGMRLVLPGETTVPLEPLSGDPLRAVIRSAATGVLPPGAVDEIARASGGNPYFATELAREARPDQAPAARPGSLRAVLAERVRRVPPAERDALQDLAVRGELHPDEVDLERLPYSLSTGLLTVDVGRLAFRHPLLAAAVLDQAGPAKVRAAHARAADTATDPVARALHRARSGRRDQRLGAELESATSVATGRGDLSGARTLARLAVDCGRSENRLVALAELEAELGNPATAAELAAELLASARSAPARNRALRILAWAQDDVAVADRLLAEAADLAGLPTDLELATRAQRASLARVANRPQDGLSQLEAVVRAAAPGTPVWATAVAHRAVLLRLLGREYDRHELAAAVEIDRTVGCDSPSLAISDAAVLAFFDDRHTDARRLLAEAEDLALRNGGYPTAGLYPAALDCRTGRLASAEARLLRYLDRKTGVDRAPVMLALATVLAWLGRDAEVRELVAQVNTLEQGMQPRDPARCLFLLGFVDLLAGRTQAAWVQLREAADEHERRGIREPSLVPVLPAAIEAAAGCGEPAAARLLWRRLDEQAEALSSRWGRAAARAGAGHLARADGDSAGALEHYAAAAEAFDQIDVPLEAARCRVALGGLLRRGGQRRDARRALEQAAAAFSAAGAQDLLRAATAELGRLGGRRPSDPTGLTASEHQVMQLAATGLRNADIAERLHLSVKTVEAHLGRVYRKLAVSNRTELAALLTTST